MEKYRDRMVAFARTLVKKTADAEDLAQDAMVKILASEGEFNGGDEWSYCAATVRNLWNDRLRKKRSAPAFDSLEEVVLGAREDGGRITPCERAAARQLAGMAEELLTPLEYKALMAVKVDGFSRYEVAKEFACSLSQVKGAISSARKTLRDAYAEFLEQAQSELQF